jgi:outer membrane lipoprotein LolB
VWWLGLAVLLSACAGVPKLSLQQQQLAWQQHRQSLAGLGDWSLSARIVVNTETEGWNGQLYWRQGTEHYQIHFNAPFGQGAFQLDGGRHGVEMRVSDGQVYTAADAETLLQQNLGWRFPLSELRYWVTGLPAPHTTPTLTLDEDGRLASLAQDHWTVRYPDYHRVGDVVLPKKVFVDNSDLNVRLVIDRWELNNG